MSGLAKIMLKQGYTISGSDLKENALTDYLRRKGATIYVGHRKENIHDPDAVVISSAISHDNPELIEAKKRNIPVLHRVDMLVQVIAGKKVLAVAGSHGKSTTTSMITWILLKEDLDPTYLIGAEMNDTNSHLGTGDLFVLETDESDGSFLKITPHIAVATNIDNDHLEYWNTVEKLESAFFKFLESAYPGGSAVVCTDDPHLNAWSKNLGYVISYSVRNKDAMWHMENIRTLGWSSKATVVKEGKQLLNLALNLPGVHNLQNALGAIAATACNGIKPEKAAAHLESYPGVKRRLEKIGEFGGVLVLDEFAHHPSEILASLKAVRQAIPKAKIIVLFQPHRYSRTKKLHGEFGKVFVNADVLITTNIYAGPGEPVDTGVGPDIITRAAVRMGHRNALTVPDKEEACEQCAKMARPGDVILTMGAGDIWKTHGLLKELLPKQAMSNQYQPDFVS